MWLIYCTGCNVIDPPMEKVLVSAPSSYCYTTETVNYDESRVEVTECCQESTDVTLTDHVRVINCPFCEEWTWTYDEQIKCPTNSCNAVACTGCEEWFPSQQESENCGCFWNDNEEGRILGIPFIKEESEEK